MKRAVFFKILAIVLSVIAAIVLGIILFKNNVEAIFKNEESEDMNFTYEYELKTNSLDFLNVDWRSGSIELIPVDVPEPAQSDEESPPDFSVHIFEKSNRKLSEEEQVQATLQNGGLEISWKQKKKLLPFLNFDLGFDFTQKNIQVEIPRYVYNSMNEINCENVSGKILIYDISPDKLKAETVSGNLNIHQIESNRIMLSSVSGEVHAEGLRAEEVELSATSGKISAEDISVTHLNAEGVSSLVHLQGKIKNINASTISGEIRIESELCPEESDLETVSGAISLAIPKNSAFTASYESVSGRFNSDFSGRYEEESQFIVGGGSASFAFSTISGNIKLYGLSS
ncbi:DUF4097 family beta strand repeat-containing protein [Scatolibacter rhodanostii]|uniref:DUF4097 family beta strand repeat-containing protein n=1 Tax=Scatolibacter rhodanostii TaxID=2014781 RepID=UPI000C073861|nr:DUF4097 family beta strand repeat-containing protein [Scatolibacter rhodanostii]